LDNLRRGTPLKAVQVFVGETVELKNDMPKVESVTHKLGEPEPPKKNWFE